MEGIVFQRQDIIAQLAEAGQKVSMQVAENANNANMDQNADGSGDFNTPSPLFNIAYRVRDYRITGGVKLVTYKKMMLGSNKNCP